MAAIAKVDNAPKPISFAGFDLVRRIGWGGTGEVWSAIHQTRLYRRPLALKVLRPEYAYDEDARHNIAQEAQTTMQISCANIVPIYDTGEYGGFPYIVMERVDGVNLRTFIDSARNINPDFDIRTAAFILHQLVSALYSAHDRTQEGMPVSVIHRDIKPGNILISSHGQVRVTDFGIAVRQSSDGARWGGTYGYMAPEQARGFPTRRSDLFSAGAVFHELVSGRRFRSPEGPREEREDRALDYCEVPTLDRVLPPQLEAIRCRLLCPEPSERFGSAFEVLKALEQWAAAEGGGILTQHKLAELYEAAVGGHSSGYTKASRAAQPSFVQAWHEQTARFGHEHAEPSDPEEPTVRVTQRSQRASAARLPGPGDPVTALLLDRGALRSVHPPKIDTGLADGPYAVSEEEPTVERGARSTSSTVRRKPLRVASNPGPGQPTVHRAPDSPPADANEVRGEASTAGEAQTTAAGEITTGPSESDGVPIMFRRRRTEVAPAPTDSAPPMHEAAPAYEAVSMPPVAPVPKVEVDRPAPRSATHDSAHYRPPGQLAALAFGLALLGFIIGIALMLLASTS